MHAHTQRLLEVSPPDFRQHTLSPSLISSLTLSRSLFSTTCVRCSSNTQARRTVRWRGHITTRTRPGRTLERRFEILWGAFTSHLGPRVVSVRVSETYTGERSTAYVSTRYTFVCFVSSLHFRARRCNGVSSWLHPLVCERSYTYEYIYTYITRMYVHVRLTPPRTRIQTRVIRVYMQRWW